ncbi:STAS domain-containing protein [Kribbella sp. NPDC048915]|uniref:STAS domain-containing protein n=1 Tax=Kribbella sp. NPDC048915 TaxID=3155148 RepID=UPI0033C5479B
MKAARTPKIVGSSRKPAALGGPFVCSWSAVGGCAVIRVAGRVDSSTTEAFAHELQHVITTKLSQVVVDLRRVTAMDAGGLDVLTEAYELATRHQGWLRVAGAGEWFTDLLRATRETRPFEHYPSLAEALPAYRPAGGGSELRA